MIAPFMQVVWAEARREIGHVRAYLVEFLADQALFLLGFLLLSGLFQIVAEGGYTSEAQLASLVGFLTWRVADGCLLRTVNSLAEDAQWGTLEQVWMGGLSPQSILIARGAVILVAYVIRVLIIAAILIALLRLSPHYPLGTTLIFLLTQIGVFGAAYVVTALHLVYKSVAAITLALSTALLFVTGALAPLSEGGLMYSVSRLLPLGAGISLLQKMIAGGASLAEVAAEPDFYWLLVTAVAYSLAAWMVLGWAQRVARRDGSLAHY
ncbi:MAG: hypothetical protein ACRDIB_17560 [Ardenticatenaceae bacterium]